ncbi:MAG: glycosyltransferase [Planctomycetota bacterium]
MTRPFAKSLWAFAAVFRDAPDIIIGYHLMPNALVALILARLVGAKAAYQMTGGPMQLIGGGFGSENILLRKLVFGSQCIERLAFAIARQFDLIVVRGQKAVDFLAKNSISPNVEIIPGSIDSSRFSSDPLDRPTDLITVSRLVEVKQTDQFLRIVALVKNAIPNIQATIVGDGPLFDNLRVLAHQLNISENVTFTGHVNDVERLLSQSKLFVLTSRWEGLSIAMIEAMSAGVVPIVADVGDLGDLAQNAKTGWTITPGSIEEYAHRIVQVLSNRERMRRFSHRARQAAVELADVKHVARRWSNALSTVCGWHDYPPAKLRSGVASLPRFRRPSAWKLWESMPTSARKIVSPIVQLLPPDRILGGRFQAIHRFLQQMDRASSNQLAEFSLTQVRRICKIAAQRSPYYRAAFDQLALDPRDIRSIEDFRGLPTINKDTIHEYAETMYTIPKDSNGVDFVTTGGTGGTPLRFHIGADRSAYEYAHLVHAWRRAGYDLRIPQAVFRGRVVKPDATGLRHEYDPILRRHFFSNFHMTDENMARYLEHFTAIGPCFLHVYPSSVDALVRFIERSKTQPPSNILGILAGSENICAEGRQRAERVLGARYFTWYGHSEKCVFAAECEHSSDYHIAQTYGFFELLDDNGDAITAPGQRGEIVGTSFLNTVVPFIRYRTGDYATFVGESCRACGRNVPIVRDIRGHRDQETLITRDGRRISLTALNMHDDTFDRVARFQFSQSEPGETLLRLVPARGFNREDRERILKNLHGKFEGAMTITIELCDEIPLTRMGKANYVDQRIPIQQELEEVGASLP